MLSDSIDDCKENIVNVEESLDGVISSIGQISLCLRVEEMVCERDEESDTKRFHPPEEEVKRDSYRLSMGGNDVNVFQRD